MRNIQGTLFGKALSVFLCWNILLAGLPLQSINVVKADYPSEPTTTITTNFEYDGNGNLTSRVDGNGNVTTFTYDTMNRLIAVDYPGGESPDVTFTYNVHGNRTSITDWTGTTDYTYDVFDRLTSVSDTQGNFILYDYDEVGNVTDLMYGNWLMLLFYDIYTYVQYEYDADNRISTVTNAFTGDTTSYQYDKAGNTTRRNLPNGAYTTYGYDVDGRLTSVEHRDDSNDLIVRYEYSLNAIGNRTQVVETDSGGSKTTTYTYDALDRLDTVTYSDGRFVDYDYDSFGNRTRLTETIDANSTVTDYYYDSDSRLLYTEVDGVEDEHFFYDAVGNLIQRIGVSPGNDKQIEYIYDYENRLIRYYDGTNNVEYVYNGLDQRVAKIVNGQRTNFLNDANRDYVQALMELDEDGIPTAVREWGNELINCEDMYGTDRHYYLHDAINGSVRRMIDSSSSVVNSYEYDAFGEPTTKIEGIANDYQFHGEVQEEETGFLFLRARYMDPETGRFLTRDIGAGELEHPTTFNPYQGLHNDPTNHVDPTGQAITLLTLGIAAVHVGAFVLGWVTPPITPFATGIPSIDLAYNLGGVCSALWSRASSWLSSRYSSRRPGGVSLNRTAEVLLDIDKITGGTYDPATGQLIVYGEQDVSLPAMSVDDLAVAARAASLGGAPIVSIDPPEVACTDNGCNDGQCYSVRYGDPVWDDVVGDYVMLDLSSKTHFGWVMFEADRVMKTLALGKDNVTCSSVTSSVPGFKTMAQRWRESGSEGNCSARFWFQPKEIELVPSPDGKSMVFSEASVELLTESKYLSNGQVFGDPDAEAFAQHFTEHYDEFAAEFPIFEELRQLAKIVGIMRWIKENNVPMDLSFIQQHQPAYYDAAPWITPKTSVTETWRDYVPGGWIDHTLTVEGGVTYCKDLQFQGASSGPEAAILTARPSETDLSWAADVNGTTYNVAAISLDKKPKDGGLSWSNNDVTVRVNGSLPLTLTRYFDSFDIAPSMFGWGWEATPYQFKFKGDRSQFNLCSLQWEGYGEVWYLDRAGQAVYKYVPSGLYDKVADPLGIADRFDPAEEILVYQYETKEVPGILFSDNKTNMTMRLVNGILLDFDMTGDLTRTEDRNGNEITYSYDPEGRLVSISQPACGKTISFTYDINNRVISAAVPGGKTVTYVYDVASNLTSSHVDAPNGRKVQYVYDNYHNLVEVQNANGQAAATRQFDVYGRVSSVSQPGIATPFLQDYSLADRATNVTGPEGFSQSMQFDENYKLTQLTDPRGNITEQTYNSYQDVITGTNAEGRITKFYYNDRGDQVAMTLPNGRSDMTIVNENGDPLFFFHVSPDAHFADYFDNEHLLISCPNEGIYSVGFTEYEYDANGNLTCIIGARGNERNFGYDSRGNQIWSQDGRGYQTDYTYDTCSHLTDVNNEEGHHVHYEYDDCDNIIQITTSAGTVDMTYDSWDHLETVTNGDPNERHTTTYSYDSNDQIISVSDPNGAVTSYGYDQRRNLSSITHDGVVRFEYDYDELNRIAQIRYFGTVADACAAVVPAYPVGGEQLQGDIPIQWHTVGDWTGNENLDIYYSTNGADWFLIDTVNYADDSYLWASGLLVSQTVQLKFVRPGDSNFRVPVTEAFQVLNGGKYYVNDNSTTDDEYCQALGQPYNGGTVTGLTPDDPVDSVQSIIDNYPLQPGDIIYVDTGTYSITNDITFDSNDSGTAFEPVTITGATENTTLITHNNPTSGSACITATDVWYLNIQNLHLTGAQYGVLLFSCLYCNVWNNECYNNGLYNSYIEEGEGAGIYIAGEGGHSVEDNSCHDNGGNGIDGTGPGDDGKPGRGWGIIVESSSYNTVKNNDCYNNGGQGGLAGSASDSPGYSEGAGIFVVTPEGSSITANNNHIVDNNCYNNDVVGADQLNPAYPASGGIARSYGIALLETTNSNIERNTTYDNDAYGGYSWALGVGEDGGDGYAFGIYGQGESGLIVTKNKSHYNYAYGAWGGEDPDDFIGVGWAAGIRLNGCSDSVVKNNLCYDNTGLSYRTFGSEQAGGAWSSGIEYTASPGCQIFNNTLLENNWGHLEGGGGTYPTFIVAQVYLGSGSGTSDVQNNICETSQDENYCLWVEPSSQSGLSSNYNLLHIYGYGWTGVWGSTGYRYLTDWQANSNQDANSLPDDPLFYNPNSGNYHLAYNSPAVDVGENLTAVQSDSDGENRPADGLDDDLTETHDIGYDEYVDTDRDELADWIEGNVTYTNKALWDTDGDGIHDGWEVRFNLDPNSNVGNDGATGDPDSDGYTNMQEYPEFDPHDPNIHPNMVPVLNQVSPSGSSIFISEGDSVLFSIMAEDGDGDPISYSWLLEDVEQATESSWTMTTNDESSGTYNVLLRVTAGGDIVTRQWTVYVSNINRPPQIDPNSLPNQTKEIGEVVILDPNYSDPDNENGDPNDDNTHTVHCSGWKSSCTFQLEPGDGGIHAITVTVTDDGNPPLADSQEVIITVNEEAAFISEADLDGDGDTDWEDLNILAAQWLQPPGIPSADIAPRPDGDSIVNMLDFSILAQHWCEGIE